MLKVSVDEQEFVVGYGGTWHLPMHLDVADGTSDRVGQTTFPRHPDIALSSIVPRALERQPRGCGCTMVSLLSPSASAISPPGSPSAYRGDASNSKSHTCSSFCLLNDSSPFVDPPGHPCTPFTLELVGGVLSCVCVCSTHLGNNDCFGLTMLTICCSLRDV